MVSIAAFNSLESLALKPRPRRRRKSSERATPRARLKDRHGLAMSLNFHDFAALHHPIEDAFAFVGQFCRGHNHASKIPILGIWASVLFGWRFLFVARRGGFG
jgi:hypothetical protein